MVHSAAVVRGVAGRQHPLFAAEFDAHLSFEHEEELVFAVHEGLALVGAIAIEIGGGALLALGYKTRLVAAGLAAFSLVTAFVFHNAIGDQNQLIHLLKNVAMAGGLLQVVAFGAGAYSVDAARSRKGLPLAA